MFFDHRNKKKLSKRFNRNEDTAYQRTKPEPNPISSDNSSGSKNAWQLSFTCDSRMFRAS